MTLAPLLAASPAIQFHALAAATALIFSAVVFLRPKGTPAHVLAGRIGATALLATAISSFWITGPNGYSWIHILSVVSLVALTGGIIGIWRNHRRSHARFMISAASGLAVAGLFTLLPGRVMFRVVFGG